MSLISYTVGNSCGIAAATFNLNVQTLPIPSIISGSANVCTGAIASLSNAAVGGTWSSSSPSIATINSSGVITGVAAGFSIISYALINSCGTAFTTTIETINALPNVGTITGANAVCVSATATLGDTILGGSWSSGTPTLAIISSFGVVLGIGSGLATISYSLTNSCGTSFATTTVTVNPLPNAGTITGSTNVCLLSTITLSDTATGGTWSASNTKATVAGNVVSGMAVGIDTVLYSVSNMCGTAIAQRAITILPLPNAGTINGITSVCVGSTITLADTSGGGAGAWSSSNARATVASGVVTGVAAGLDSIKYTVTNSCGSATQTKPISVNPLPMAGTISSPIPNLCIGATTTFTESTTGGVWGSITPTIATVDPSTGVITALGLGYDTVKYTFFNMCGSAIASFVMPVLAAPSAITGLNHVCAGATDSLFNTTIGGTWSSSNPASISIDAASGVVTGASSVLDIATITYSTNCGSPATAAVTVFPLPYAGIIIGTDSTVCAGASISLSETAPVGTWNSANLSANVIGGVVTGMSSGVDTILYIVNTAYCGTAVAKYPVTINPLPVAGLLVGTDSVCVGASVTITPTSTGGVWGSTNTRATNVGGAITGVAAGLDTVTYTVSSVYCSSATVTQPIIIKPLPNAGLITGLDSVCVSASITLHDTVSGGVWGISNNRAVDTGAVVTGVSTGLDTLIYTYTNYCGTANTKKKIYIKPLPVVGSITGTTVVCQGAHITLTDATTGGIWGTANSKATVLSGVVTGVFAGYDTIKYSVSNTCGTTTATHTITINPSPNAGTISGADSVCLGATITLLDTTYIGVGVWSSSNTAKATVSGGVVTGTGLGSANITYTVSNSCGLVFTTLHENIITTVPPSISGISYVCLGGNPDTLNCTPAGGDWVSANTNAIVSGGIVVGISAGLDTIKYAYTNTCGTKDTNIVISIYTGYQCDSLLGLKENIAINNIIAIYPNPTNGIFTIELPETGVNTTISIMDLFGKVLQTKEVADNSRREIVFNTAGLARGTYIVKTTTGGKVYINKLVVL